MMRRVRTAWWHLVVTAEQVALWLLSCWPLALRSTVDQLEWAKRSMAMELDRTCDALESTLDELDQVEAARTAAVRRAVAAERERDRLRAPAVRRPILVRRPHASDAVVARIDEAVS